LGSTQSAWTDRRAALHRDDGPYLHPWLMWGFAIHIERLHDRNKRAWWLLVFYVVPAVLGQLAKTAWFA
jgi:hypothetical protein